jgi:hypothetical protein
MLHFQKAKEFICIGDGGRGCCTYNFMLYVIGRMLNNILIGHINVNKGVFCLIISYLQIKSYNVLNYSNCSTDWPFPLTFTL